MLFLESPDAIRLLVADGCYKQLDGALRVRGEARNRGDGGGAPRARSALRRFLRIFADQP